VNARRGVQAIVAAGLIVLAGCGASKAPDFPLENDGGAPAEQNIGERIFVDTRFAEYFAANMTGVNDPLAVGDPVVQTVQNVNTGPMPGYFAGQSVNCRSCHFVVEYQGVAGAGNRTYADFTTRSPIPLPMGNFTTTPRNAIQMVGSLTPRTGPTFLHFDGQFNDPVDLVKSTLTGRNFGWGPTQFAEAEAHIAKVIREDNGVNKPAQEYGENLSYAVIFLGTQPGIPKDVLLPAQYRLDVTKATDDEIVTVVAQVVAQYTYGLLFKQDQYGRYYASPYDVLLRINNLPVQPKAGETVPQYDVRLAAAVNALSSPKWVTPSMGTFAYHAQPFQFGATEFQGLKIFLTAATNAVDGSQHAGNCVACHNPPNFSDFNFHNTGVAQEEYDNANGTGAFTALTIPNQADRTANFNQYMPVSANHPTASEQFRHAAVAGQPQFADLGLWNIFLNPDVPNPQSDLQTVVCKNPQDCAVDQGLATTIAKFKTPMLRDLEDSAPYFHNGSAIKFNDVVSFYVNSSTLARKGLLRNAPAEFQNMSISDSDVQALAAFLASLTEDYDDA
jgi:hypothetical protein